LVSGYLSDRFKSYWALTIGGYALSVFAVPFLALSGNWQIASLLFVLERLGKAIRTPARDVLLSAVTEKVGRGKGFGIHEALDQIGAIGGPLLISLFLYLNRGYRSSLAVLFVPAILTLMVIFFAKWRYPVQAALLSGHDMSKKTPKGKLPAVFWLYTLFIVFSLGGYASFQIISYHLKNQAIVSDAQIPLLFAFAMGIDGIVALIVGRAYDRVGLTSLFGIPIIGIFIPFFAFSSNYGFIWIAVALWGAVMGMQETIMRAAIADMVSIETRGMAYGIFNTAYGLSWFVGSSIMGFIYNVSIQYLISFCVIIEIISLPVFWLIWKRRFEKI
ncbi:MAG: MFS transporter, partial [Candidatus Omnitrophica bacterium]|nr:MFS transporter [Candidatus Omnitrophota bacterium]